MFLKENSKVKRSSRFFSEKNKLFKITWDQLFLSSQTNCSPTQNLIGWPFGGFHSSSPCWVDRSPKMSLLLLLKACSNLRGKSDRIARVTFRGMLWRNFVRLWAVNGFERFLRLLVWRKRSLDGSLGGQLECAKFLLRLSLFLSGFRIF